MHNRSEMPEACKVAAGVRMYTHNKAIKGKGYGMVSFFRLTRKNMIK